MDRQPISEDNIASLNPSEIPLWMMRKEIFVFDYGVIGNSILIETFSLLEFFRIGRTEIF
jgi:hypothetical protein